MVWACVMMATRAFDGRRTLGRISVFWVGRGDWRQSAPPEASSSGACDGERGAVYRDRVFAFV
jgi:hypothetical protein